MSVTRPSEAAIDAAFCQFPQGYADRLEQIKRYARDPQDSRDTDMAWLIERVERLEGMIRQALDTLDVPGVFLEQRAPVVEAVTILRAALGNHD